MSDGGVRRRDGRPQRAGGSAFELVLSKLRCPEPRPGTVHRYSLIRRLEWGTPCPVVTVVAPAGFGKTTLLSQWAEHDGKPFAWVSVEEPDNDPKVLLTYIAEALDAVEPISGRVFDALASPGNSVLGSAVPRLASAFASMTSPAVLALDDVHVLHNRECRAALSALADHVPVGSRLVLAGRARPPLRIARLRAEGKLVEIGAGDLALTAEEAAELLHEAGIALDEGEMTELHRRTEGWPAALYLAALYLREGGSLPPPWGGGPSAHPPDGGLLPPPLDNGPHQVDNGPPRRAVITFGGANRLVSDYVEAELLSRISHRQRVFLTRTAVLDRLSGPLCEAVLDLPGSSATLAELARSNLLLVPLDGWGGWYRYHHLFRDMLLGELHRREPALVPALQRRTAAWYTREGMPEEALEYSMAAGDIGGAAGLVGELAVPTLRQGRVVTLQQWFQWLDDQGGIDGYPMVTVLAALIFAWVGRAAEADKWADAVDRWQCRDNSRLDERTVAWAALLRAFLCRRGAGQMRADADEAAQMLAAEHITSSGPALLQGVARLLSGDIDGSDASLTDAVRLGEDTGSHELAAAALSELSLVAVARCQWPRAETFARQARSTLHGARAEESYVTPLVCAVQAQMALHRGDTGEARQELVHAQRARPTLTYAIPHIAVQARIELTRAHLTLADVAGAKTLMREIDELLRHRPGLGTLVGEAKALRLQLAKVRGPGSPGASALTAAELRLLPLLATHLSFPEIASELFLSPNTVKTQVASLYRKLGASSRKQAVSRSRELALLEG
jgi:LuxR family maltose regulon positive regulatory protein